jgi:hypothetical protein
MESGQIARAFVTALTHEDADTQRRAEDRLRRWGQVLEGLSAGGVRPGARVPVAGLPSWVTTEFARGDPATGQPAAGGPLLAYELAVARRAGAAPDRGAVFAYYLTDAGLAELWEMLDNGRYDVSVPEEAALLTVAWLLRAGDRLGALTLLDRIEPLAGLLRFTPRPSDSRPREPSVVSRARAGEVREALKRRRPHQGAETAREALTVWNPFSDELLRHWLDTAERGRVATRMSARWIGRGARLLARYDSLATAHRLCTKHRKPKENLGILRLSLAEVVAGRRLSARQRGLLQHAVDSMVRRHGMPGSAQHAELRRRQLADAGRPTYHEIAQVVVARLSACAQDAGLPSVDVIVRPVDTAEQAQTGVPAGTPVPLPVRRVVWRARSGTVEELICRKAISSADVLAELVPEIAAATTAMAYPDNALRMLMAATCRAFRAHRPVLLMDLPQQAGLDELPWVRAVAPHRRGGDDARQQARAALVRLSELALSGFPGTILPNPLVREFDALVTEAGLAVPLVAEPAADTFTGEFPANFLHAAQLAAGVLQGSLYARYYGIDYAAVLDLADVQSEPGSATTPSGGFAALCRFRANAWGQFSVAANGAVIEQAQILTTHNLATVAAAFGTAPVLGWADLARRAFTTVCRLVQSVEHTHRRLRTVKEAAYAWRQMLFFLSLVPLDEQERFVGWARQEAAARQGASADRLGALVAGLEHVVTGGDLDDVAGRRFLGWSVGPHWLLAEQPVLGG